MTGYIGCFGLIAIGAFIVFLFVRRKKVDGEMANFYKENSLYTTDNAPPLVRESLGSSDNLYCCRANLTLANGTNVEYCFWEWFIRSTTMVNGSSSTTFSHYLAVSFAPDTVSDEFIQKALAWADKSGADVSQKVKDFFVLNTETPYRAEILADGTLLICWHALKRRDVYDAKINWLKQNLSIRITPEIALLEEIHAMLPVEPQIAPPKIGEPEITPTEITQTVPVGKVDGTIFYKNDSYAALRYTFNAAWTNLTLELHHHSAVFDKEGYDEFEGDTLFADPNSPNEAVFTLTSETAAETAEKLFEKHFGGHALVLRDGISVEKRESLAYCNNPFRLPLNVYTYGEFKRRFTGRWTNLSIELYDTAPHNGGLWRVGKELADDFEMKNLKNADRAFLHDYVFISDWGNSLRDVKVSAGIKNIGLGVYAERNLVNERLKDFQAMGKV